MTIRAVREPDLGPKVAGFVYQVQAVNATKDLPYAAIFHEQGLGKTKIGIDLALYWLTNNIVDSVLIVTKRGLIQNWVDELRAHTHITPRLLSQDKRANFLAFNSPARIYLTHYEVLKAERKRFKLFLKTRRIAVILDEAHKIKNPESDLTEAIFDLAPDFTRRVIMTGTPVANRPYDIWSQVFFLDQGKSLGQDFSSFKKALDLSNDLSRDASKVERFEKELSGLFHRIQHFSVRETKQAADIHLPEKILRDIFSEMEPRQAEIYHRFQNDLAAIVVKHGVPEYDNAEETLKRLLRLIQVASNPNLVDDSYHNVPGKFPILLGLIEEITDRKEKVIVWTAFIDNVDWLARELRTFNAVKVHGRLSYDERAKSIRNFKTDPECQILIATPASAKEGLTLTVANNAIFFDRSFSLDDYLQAQDRIHRISQNKDCTVTNIIATNTVDEWVDTLLAAKHLAAQLGQGDITREQYNKQASYAFGQMVRDVLGLDRDE
ncbi:MAG: DEAD/DEAH box helicase [Acidobacteriaceae bacterium]|nr:DEAD/DEAH box helicase [Acidobacteriaceae bacterium]